MDSNFNKETLRTKKGGGRALRTDDKGMERYNKYQEGNRVEERRKRERRKLGEKKKIGSQKRGER